jgi:hypothetical protein
MRTFDTILMGLTVGVARLLRGLLRTYNRLIGLVRPQPPVPFGKCDKVVRLHNNRVVSEASDEWRPLPITTEEHPHRRIIQ